MSTRAQVPWGLPKAPLIPVWSRSALAHESILLIRRAWNRWTLTIRRKASFPALLVMYLLQAMWAASRVSLETFSSQLTRWTQKGNSSTPFFIPIIDPDLGVRDTTAVPGLWVWLALDLAVASCWSWSER